MLKINKPLYYIPRDKNEDETRDVGKFHLNPPLTPFLRNKRIQTLWSIVEQVNLCLPVSLKLYKSMSKSRRRYEQISGVVYDG